MIRSRRKWLVMGFGALVALGVAGWWMRERVAGLLGLEREPVVVSAEAAAAAEGKLERLRSDGETARLSGIELSSLLRYRSSSWFTSRVHEPSVALAGDTIRVSGTIATSELPSHPDLDRVRVLLPDSSQVDVMGRVGALPSGRASLDIERVEFAGIPIPERYYPEVLERFGRRHEEGLGPNALAIPLPEGVGAVRAEGGYLVLTP